MKKTIVFLALLFIFRITVFSQTNEDTIQTSDDIFVSTDGVTSSKYNADDRFTYYFANNHEGPSVFSKDTMVLVKTPINDHPPMLVLTKDSKFNFEYPPWHLRYPLPSALADGQNDHRSQWL